MDNQRPQLNLTDLRRLRWLLGGILGILSAWTVFHMEVEAGWLLAVFTLVVPVFTLKPVLAQRLPPLVHRLAFPVIVATFAFDWWQSREPLPAMIRLDLLLLAYRCVSPRGRREDLQLILLALFVVVVTGVFTVSIAFVLQILCFTGVALLLLLAITLSDARGGGRSETTPGWENSDWTELLWRMRQAIDPRVITLGVALFGGVVALSALLFMALPRFEISNSFFLDRLITRQSLTGFSEDVRFGEVVNIQQDTRMAFAVDVSDPAAVPAEPYWRMLVLDEYSGQGFRVSEGLRASFQIQRDKNQIYGGTVRSREDKTLWTFYYQPGISRYLPMTGGFGRVTFGEPQALQKSDALRLAALQNDPGKMVGYRVEGMDTDGVLRDPFFAREGVIRPAVHERRRWRRPPPPDAPVPEEESEWPAIPENAPDFLRLNLTRPEDEAQLRAWVDEMGGPGHGEDVARRAAAWLQRRHGYSLSMKLAPGEGDPLVRWMASNQPGHCELFAGGLVLLARAAGVPARMVTGFKGGVWNPTSGSITVRNSDAHAWVEIWDEPRSSWLRADATPGSRITPLEQNDISLDGTMMLEQDNSWGARMDGLRIFWYRRIVSFDSSAQQQMLRGTKERLESGLTGLRQRLETWGQNFTDWLGEPWNWRRATGLILIAAALAAATWWGRRLAGDWWLAWRSRRASSHREDPVRQKASRWLARYEAAESRLIGGESLARAKADLLRLRFGPRESWPSPARTFRRSALELKAARRAGPKGAKPGR